MLNLKKTAVAVLALGSSAVFAGTMGPVCSAVNVTVPCESTAWDFGADALYLRPTVGNGSVVGVNVPAADVNTYNYRTLQPNYNWGFKLEGSYHFNTGNDVNLNWYHLNNGNNFTLGDVSLFNNNFVTTTSTAATASVSPNWNAVNLEFGQHVDFGEFKSIRFHGGVSYVRVNNEIAITQTGAVDSATVNSISGLERNTTYNGFGPRLGADMTYDWGNGFGIYANGAAALYAGNSSSNDSYTLTDLAGVTQTGYPSSSNLSFTSVVPELEAKVGAKYTYAMAQGDLTLDVGWLWINYFQANIARGPETSLTSNSPVPNAQNFGLEGLYFGLKWLGNVA
jgi:hypothetical protein